MFIRYYHSISDILQVFLPARAALAYNRYNEDSGSVNLIGGGGSPSGEGIVTAVSQEDIRICPACGSEQTVLIQRGLVGPTDESDQYFTCESCGRRTYQILSRTMREMRSSQIAVGRSILADGDPYTVLRILKVGLDEHLIYVRPDRGNRRRGNRQ